MLVAPSYGHGREEEPVTPGRDEQFHAFVVTERAGMVRTARLLAAGDGHLAEDLVQSTLTSLYVAWPAFRRAGNRGAYVQRSLVNALIDERRRPWRRREQSLPVLPDRTDPSAHDQLPGAGEDRTQALYRALRDLPPGMRAAVVLRYFHDLSVAETADVLTCSQGTVKSQTARALDKLREALGATLAAADSAAGERAEVVPVAHRAQPASAARLHDPSTSAPTSHPSTAAARSTR